MLCNEPRGLATFTLVIRLRKIFMYMSVLKTITLVLITSLLLLRVELLPTGIPNILCHGFKNSDVKASNYFTYMNISFYGFTIVP